MRESVSRRGRDFFFSFSFQLSSEAGGYICMLDSFFDAGWLVFVCLFLSRGVFGTGVFPSLCTHSYKSAIDDALSTHYSRTIYIYIP